MPPGDHLTGNDSAPETGRTLADLVRQHGTVAPAETMRILAEAADALDFAHSKGFAHRNLTARSVRVDTTGTVSLTGLAAGHGNTDAETVVIDADAEFSQADADADIHALAAVGYLCLTGRALDRSAPQPFPPTVPPVVGHPLWLALGVVPDTRTPSAAKFAQLCRGAMAGLGVTAPMRPAAVPAPPAGPPPAAAPPKRQRRAALVAGVTAAVVVLAVGVLLAVSQPWARSDDASAGGSRDGDGATHATSSARPGNSASRGDTGKSESSSASPSDADSNDSGGGDGDDGDDSGGDTGGGGDDGGGGDGGEDDIYSGPMPDVVGMTVKQAYEAIVTEAYVQTDVNYSSSDPTCVVHSQYPSPGTHLDENSEPSITADGSAGDCGF